MTLSDLLDNFKTLINKYHYTKSQSDGLITTHNGSNSAHSDIRNSINNKISKSSTVGLVKNDGSIDTNRYITQHQDISGLEKDIENLQEYVDTIDPYLADWINCMAIAEVLVTYTDGTSETLKLYGNFCDN